MSDYDPMDDFNYDRESKKKKAQELMEGFHYIQQDDAKRMEQSIVNDEFQKIREEYGLTPAQEIEIQQALMNNVALQAKAIRKSARKRAVTILKGLAPKGSSDPKGPAVYKSPESKAAARKKPPASQAVEAARRRVAESRRGLDRDEQDELLDAVLGDMIGR